MLDDTNESIQSAEEKEAVEAHPQAEDQVETQGQTEIDEDIPEEYPEDEEKRREAFIKMRQALKRLKENNLKQNKEAEEDAESVLESIRGVNAAYPEPITPDTDINQVTARMTMAERMAYEARMEAQRLRIEQENQKLYREIPSLDPSHPDFKKPETKLLDRYIAGQILMAREMGKPYDIVKIAREAKALFSSIAQSQQQQAAKEAVEKLQKKELGSLEAKGSSVTIPRSQNMEELRRRVRLGDEQARIEYLKQILPEDI